MDWVRVEDRIDGNASCEHMRVHRKYIHVVLRCGSWEREELKPTVSTCIHTSMQLPISQTTDGKAIYVRNTKCRQSTLPRQLGTVLAAVRQVKLLETDLKPYLHRSCLEEKLAIP